MDEVSRQKEAAGVRSVVSPGGTLVPMDAECCASSVPRMPGWDINVAEAVTEQSGCPPHWKTTARGAIENLCTGVAFRRDPTIRWITSRLAPQSAVPTCRRRRRWGRADWPGYLAHPCRGCRGPPLQVWQRRMPRRHRVRRLIRADLAAVFVGENNAQLRLLHATAYPKLRRPSARRARPGPLRRPPQSFLAP